jgi:hypothetical protein
MLNMKTSLVLVVALALATACGHGGSSDSAATTVTDTVVTPVKTTDTTVVQKKVDVQVDTLKKTHNKP